MPARLAAILALVVVLLPAPAQAQEEPHELPTEITDALGTSAEEIAELEPNRAWDGLGLFSDDSLRLIEAATIERPFITYGFGDDPTGPPVFVPDGGTPIGSGSFHFTLPDGWVPPAEGWGTDMAFAQTAGSQLQPGDDVVLLWMEMDSDYDFSSTRQINEGFPLAVPGLPVWNSTFAGDTWENANVIPNAIYDNGVLELVVRQYEPPQGFPLIDLPAFYFRAGNIMAMAVSTDGLVAIAASAGEVSTTGEGETRSLLWTGSATDVGVDHFESALEEILYEVRWYGWSHITENGQFTPGFIAYLIDTYGLADTQFAVSTIAQWLLPIPVEELTEPTPETTPPSSVPAETAPPSSAPATAPPTTLGTPTDTGGDGGGSGPWVPVGIGGGLIALIGGLIFLTAKKSEPKGDCSDEKARWEAEEGHYQETVNDVEKAQKTLADATESRTEAGKAYTKAKADVPPDGTDSVTDENTGETITSLDRWLRDRYAAEEWNRYQNDPNPETAKAYEDAMREADTPEAREARRRDGEAAAQAAEQARQRFEAAKEAEKAAESALGRRVRDVESAREIADQAKKAYEDCMKEKAEFDRKSAEAKKRYDEAMERERERSKDKTDGGDQPTGPGGGTAITTPPPAELGGDCWPPGSRERRPRAQGEFEVMSEADIVTFTFFRNQGTWSSSELTEKSGDPFLGQFGDAVSGADERNAVFHLRSADAKRVDVGKLLQAWQARAAWAENTWFVTKTDSVELTITWDYRKVSARCDNPFICSAQATWELEGPPVYTEPSSSRGVESKTFTFGGQDPTADLQKLWSRLDKHITEREQLYDFQLACNEGR